MTNSKNQNTTVELGFPIFEGENHPHEKQFNFINNKISLMEKFKTESTNKELCEFIVVLESNDYFDFYSYQKQNLNTNYCFLHQKIQNIADTLVVKYQLNQNPI